MKRLLALLLLLSCVALPACTDTPGPADTTEGNTAEAATNANTTEAETEAPAITLYYVRTPEQPPEEELRTKVYTYESYDEALAHATKPDVAVLGYAVYDEEGTFLGGKYDELVTNLLYNGKHVTDYVRIKKYKYGNASVNPAINYWRRVDPHTYGRPTSERLVSCDRLVDWILYDTGFTDQPTDTGMHINAYMDPKYGMMGWCIAQGFEKVRNSRALQAGDIVFTGHREGDPNFATHVYLFAGECDQSGNHLYYRYDGGSDNRILCTGPYKGNSESGQPFKEPVGDFVVAYRPVASALKEPLGGK